MKKKALLLVACALLITQTACTAKRTEDSASVSESDTQEVDTSNMCQQYEFLIQEDGSKRTLKKGEYNPVDIFTYIFDDQVVFEGSEDVQKEILENGKNPGLGVQKLQEEGITGKGINIAIIDQKLLIDHPEFEGKIVAYHDGGSELGENLGSMHGPAVTGLLVGNETGVAPDAKVYYAGVASDEANAAYFADALNWITDQNEQLADGEKIRVVSISACPANNQVFSNTDQYKDAVKRAQAAGILVLDCDDDNKSTGIFGPVYYNPEDRENPAQCRGGFPDNPYVLNGTYIGVPSSYRTVAQEYKKGEYSYRYEGTGGISWGIPFAAGVLAMGWQLDPTLSNDQILKMITDTSVKGADGTKIINPTAFIEAVKSNVK